MIIDIDNYAVLNQTPLKIENFSFVDSEFHFLPLEAGSLVTDILPQTVSCSTQFQMLDDSGKHIQVDVAIKNDPTDKGHTKFFVRCIAIYMWNDEHKPDEKTLKMICSWSVAVQVGAIRQHIIQETAKGPFRTPYFMPVFLVEIKEKPNLSKTLEKNSL
jgi:hypothetical protein